MSLVTAVAPVDTDDDFAAGLRVAQRYLHSLGITAWQDAEHLRRRQRLPDLQRVRRGCDQRRSSPLV